MSKEIMPLEVFKSKLTYDIAYINFKEIRCNYYINDDIIFTEYITFKSIFACIKSFFKKQDVWNFITSVYSVLYYTKNVTDDPQSYESEIIPGVINVEKTPLGFIKLEFHDWELAVDCAYEMYKREMNRKTLTSTH